MVLKDIVVEGNGGWVGATARLGLPIVISLLLTGFLIFSVTTTLANVQTTTINNGVMLEAVAKELVHMETQQNENMRIMRNLALITCINVAKSDLQGDSCLRAAEK
jgi:hypothetical protein